MLRASGKLLNFLQPGGIRILRIIYRGLLAFKPSEAQCIDDDSEARRMGKCFRPVSTLSERDQKPSSALSITPFYPLPPPAAPRVPRERKRRIVFEARPASTHRALRGILFVEVCSQAQNSPKRHFSLLL